MKILKQKTFLKLPESAQTNISLWATAQSRKKARSDFIKDRLGPAQARKTHLSNILLSPFPATAQFICTMGTE